MAPKREEDLKKLLSKTTNNLSHKKVNNNKTVKAQIKITIKTNQISNEPNHQHKIAKHAIKEINNCPDYHFQTDFLKGKGLLLPYNNNKNLRFHNKRNNLS